LACLFQNRVPPSRDDDLVTRAMKRLRQSAADSGAAAGDQNRVRVSSHLPKVHRLKPVPQVKLFTHPEVLLQPDRWHRLQPVSALPQSHFKFIAMKLPSLFFVSNVHLWPDKSSA